MVFVRVTSETSRLWERVRLMETVSSSARSGEELGLAKGGEGGRGEIGLWNEWNESTLEEMLGDPLACFTGTGMAGVGSDVETVLSDSCGGAVIARPPFMDMGRVRVFKRSYAPSPGLSGSGGISVISSLASPLPTSSRATTRPSCDTVPLSSALSDWLDFPVWMS